LTPSTPSTSIRGPTTSLMVLYSFNTRVPSRKLAHLPLELLHDAVEGGKITFCNVLRPADLLAHGKIDEFFVCRARRERLCAEAVILADEAEHPDLLCDGGIGVRLVE